MQSTQASPGLRGVGHMILSIILFIWSATLLLETMVAFSLMPPTMALARLGFTVLLFIGGLRAWKSGRERRTLVANQR